MQEEATEMTIKKNVVHSNKDLIKVFLVHNLLLAYRKIFQILFRLQNTK